VTQVESKESEEVVSPSCPILFSQR
jgi:hypothetical protein